MMRKKKRIQLNRILLCVFICVWTSVSFSTTVYAGNYNSWTEGSSDERNLHDSGTGSELFDENNSFGTDELIDQMTKDDSNYFEVQICKLINSLSYGIAAVERAARMQIDTIVLGRVAKNASVNSFGFDLSDGNLYGSLGSIVYAALRNFMFGVFGIYFLYMMLAYLIKGTGTSRANLKDALYNFLFVYALLYAVPIAVDYLLLFRDGLLKVFTEKALSAAEDFSFVDAVLQQAADETRMLYSLLALCFVCGSVWLGFNYLKIALQQAYLFGIFPLVAFRSFSDKNILNKWFSYFFANALVPLFDCIGFVMLIYELRLNPSNSLAGQFMALVIFFSIIPSRNLLIQLFGGPVPGRGFSIIPMALMAARLLGRGRGGVTPSGGTNATGNGNGGNTSSGNGGNSSGGSNSGGAPNGMIERTVTPNSELAVGSNNGENTISGSSSDGGKTITSDMDYQGGDSSDFSDTGVENEKIMRDNDFSVMDADNTTSAENEAAYTDNEEISQPYEPYDNVDGQSNENPVVEESLGAPDDSEQYAGADNVQDITYTTQGEPDERVSEEVAVNRMDVNDSDGIKNEAAAISDETDEMNASIPMNNQEPINTISESDDAINQTSYQQQSGDGVDGISEQSANIRGDDAQIELSGVIEQQGAGTTSTVYQRGYAQGTDATVNQSRDVTMNGDGSSAVIQQGAKVENTGASTTMNSGGLSANGSADALGAPVQMRANMEQLTSAQRANVDVDTTVQTKYISQSSDPSASIGVRTAQNVGRVAKGVAVAGGVAGGMMGFASTAISGNATTMMSGAIMGGLAGGAPGGITASGANNYIDKHTHSPKPTNSELNLSRDSVNKITEAMKRNSGVKGQNNNSGNNLGDNKSRNINNIDSGSSKNRNSGNNGSGGDKRVRTESQSKRDADALMGNTKNNRK